MDTKGLFELNCTIYGPSNFGIVTFNTLIGGAAGSAPSGTLYSLQTYLLECIEPITGSTFSTRT